MVVQNLVDDSEDVAGALGVIGGRVAGLTSAALDGIHLKHKIGRLKSEKTREKTEDKDEDEEKKKEMKDGSDDAQHRNGDENLSRKQATFFLFFVLIHNGLH